MKTLNIPEVGVLLAAYNGKPWIEEQIQSILNQEKVNSTIFVSVDMSTDGTEKLINHLAKHDTRIVELPSGQRFGGAATNFFRLIRDVDFERFNYISFSDQDDIWYRDKLRRATETLESQGLDGYSSNVNAFWSDRREMFIDKSQSQVEWDFLFESAGPGCTFVMNKRLALDIQNFVRRHQEDISSVWLHDWFTYAFARAHGYKWYIDKYPSMRYRQHVDNQVGVNFGLKALIYRMRLVLSGGALEQSLLIARLCGLENHPFVRKLFQNTRLAGLYLTFNAAKCRRKPKDRIYFVVSGLMIFLVGREF